MCRPKPQEHRVNSVRRKNTRKTSNHITERPVLSKWDMLSVGMQATVATITDCLRGSVMATIMGVSCSANDEVKLGIEDRFAWSHCESAGSHIDPGVGGAACAAHEDIGFEECFSGDIAGVTGSVVGVVICEVVGEGVVSLLSPGEGVSFRWTRRGRLNLCLRNRRSFFSFDDGRGGGVSLLGVGGRAGAGGGVIIMVVFGERKGDTEQVGGGGVEEVGVKKVAST